MSETEAIKQQLEAKFDFLKDKVMLQRERRLWADVDYQKFHEVFEYAYRNLEFTHLCTITGLDEGVNLAFIYHLARKDGIMLNLKTRVLKDKEAIKSVVAFFPGAAIYERELIDLLGAKVDGVPTASRYPLPDDWPAEQYPLRKDWDASVLKGMEGKINE